MTFNVDQLSVLWMAVQTAEDFETKQACQQALQYYALAMTPEILAHIAKLEAALPPQGDGWQDIASAPRDRTVIWLGSATEQRRELGWWGGVQWNSQPLGTRIQFDVTHWRPLPAPPAAEIERTKGGG